ncbi:hypothetical protein B0H14DRAFT_2347961 [Mycena olivaceomarginata]|nr:hypothetical protein B0H14DRAFT_2347961 [Mycena olivaceomarginata]
MGYRYISRGVKIAALNLYEHGRLSPEEILKCVGFSEHTFYCVLNLWKTTSGVVTGKKSSARPRALHRDDVSYLIFSSSSDQKSIRPPSTTVYVGEDMTTL